jgi:hypothetical protein
MHIVTVSTESKYYFPYLKESCRRHGKELEVLGWGEKWQGFNWRYIKMLDYLKTKPVNDIVCFMDGYDVLCVRDLNEMEEVFKSIQKRTNCKLVVSEDISMKLSFLAELTFGKCQNIKLNAGLYMGYVKDVIIIIEKIYKLNPTNDADDQILMTKYCNMNNDIYIDKDKELFLSIGDSLNNIDTNFVYDNGIVYEGSRPFFIHAPAYGYLDNTIIKLGYGDCNVKNELFNNFFEKKFIFYLYAALFNIYTVIILILLLILNNLNILKSKNTKKPRFIK